MITVARSDNLAITQTVSEYLLNGGNNALNVDGSGTPQLFTFEPSQPFYFSRLLLYIEGSTNFSSTEFANIAALTNGVLLESDDTTLENWQDNVDLVTTFYDANGYSSLNNANRSIAGRWTFRNLTPNNDSIVINNYFRVTIRDNLSTLSIFRMKVQGVYKI